MSVLSGTPGEEVRKYLRNPRRDEPAYKRIASEKRKLEKWLSDKVNPKNTKGLIELTVSFAKSRLGDHAGNLSTQELLQAYASWQEQLYRTVQACLSQISYHQVHIVLGLNKSTINKIKNGELVKLQTLLDIAHQIR